MSDSKEKIGNTINRLDLLYRLFINHGDYGGSSPVPWIRDDLLVVWRGMEDPPPKLPWPGEDAEVGEYTSPPPHETKTISMRFIGRGLVGMVRETMQHAHVSVWLRPNTLPKGVGRQSSCRRSDHNTYPPLGLHIVEVGGSRLLSP